MKRTLRCFAFLSSFFCYNISIKITHEITTIVNEHRETRIDTRFGCFAIANDVSVYVVVLNHLVLNREKRDEIMIPNEKT